MEVLQKQTQIYSFPLLTKEQQDLDRKLKILESKLSLCGRFASKNLYCKHTEPDHLVRTLHSPMYCEIRYCDNPICLVHRFKRVLETFKDISRFSELNSLWHFSIGFEPISESDFKQNFTKYKKRNEYLLNRFFSKLKNKGIIMQGIRVLDFSFKTEGFVFLHYHFAVLPVNRFNLSNILSKMQLLRFLTIRKQRNKIPFHIQSFGLAKKTAIFSYFAIRSAGMYKYDMTLNSNYKHIQGNLLESIKHHKYIFLKNVLTPIEYIKSFYNQAFFSTIGGIKRPKLHGSNITDNMPLECPCHGKLEKGFYRIEIIFDLIHFPTDYGDDSNTLPKIEVIKVK